MLAKFIASGATPMPKLKLCAIPDDRHIKLTVELPGAVHRNLVACAEVPRRDTRQTRRPNKTDRADARAVHIDRSGPSCARAEKSGRQANSTFGYPLVRRAMR